MRPTPESEARLRAALAWSARQMPSAAPTPPIEAPIRRRLVVGIAASIATAGAVTAGLLVMQNRDAVQTITSKVPGPATTTVPVRSTPVRTTPLTSAPPTTMPATSVATTATYVVQPYDWIGSVAEKFGTTMEALVALNGWPDGIRHVFLTGDTILVPAVPGTAAG